MKVRAVMTPDPVVIGRKASIGDAASTMDRLDVRHLVVVEDERVVGVLSDRDLLAAGAKRRGDSRAPKAEDPRVEAAMHSPVITIAPDDGVVMAAVELSGRGIGCLPVLEKHKLVGILTELDLLGAYRAACRQGGLSGETDPPVEEKMHTGLTTIDEDGTLDQALALCKANGMRHLPVLSAGALVGILSDRDLRRALGERRDGQTSVHELMTRPVRTIGATAPLSEAARAMVAHRISSLPVVSGRSLVGILTTTDLLDHCMEALREADSRSS